MDRTTGRWGQPEFLLVTVQDLQQIARDRHLRSLLKAFDLPLIVLDFQDVAVADGSPHAAYRDQTVEVALGPNAAFPTDNVGTLTRRLPADRLVTAVPSRWGKPRPPREPKTPRVVELLRKAIEWRRQFDAGEVPNQAAIARR